MGKFFNEKLMNLHKFPVGLEAMRKEFNKEQHGKIICGETPQETGTVSPDGGQQISTEPVIPPRRGRPVGTGRTNKGNTRKARGNKRV